MKMFMPLCVCLSLFSGLYAASIQDRFAFQRPAVPLNQALSKNPHFGTFFTFCNKSLEPLVIHSIAVTPNVLKPGGTNNLTIIIELTEEVTGGKINIDLKFSFLIHFSKTLDLCTSLTSTPYPCPLERKGYNFIQTITIPSKIPKGHITGMITVNDSGEKELACLNVDVHID